MLYCRRVFCGVFLLLFGKSRKSLLRKNVFTIETIYLTTNIAKIKACENSKTAHSRRLDPCEKKPKKHVYSTCVLSFMLTIRNAFL